MDNAEKRLLAFRTRKLVDVVEEILDYKIIGGAEEVKEAIGEIGRTPVSVAAVNRIKQAIDDKARGSRA